MTPDTAALFRAHPTESALLAASAGVALLFTAYELAVRRRAVAGFAGGSVRFLVALLRGVLLLGLDALRGLARPARVATWYAWLLGAFGVFGYPPVFLALRARWRAAAAPVAPIAAPGSWGGAAPVLAAPGFADDLAQLYAAADGRLVALAVLVLLPGAAAGVRLAAWPAASFAWARCLAPAVRAAGTKALLPLLRLLGRALLPAPALPVPRALVLGAVAWCGYAAHGALGHGALGPARAGADGHCASEYASICFRYHRSSNYILVCKIRSFLACITLCIHIDTTSASQYNYPSIMSHFHNLTS